MAEKDSEKIKKKILRYMDAVLKDYRLRDALSSHDYYCEQEPFVADMLVLEDERGTFEDFLNGKSVDGYPAEERDFSVSISSDTADIVFDTLKEDLFSGHFPSLSRNRFVFLLEEGYKNIEESISYKESPLFEQNCFFLERFVGTFFLWSDVKTLSENFCKQLHAIDSSVISPEKKAGYKRELFKACSESPLAVFTESPCKENDLEPVKEALSLKSETAEALIFSLSQTGLDFSFTTKTLTEKMKETGSLLLQSLFKESLSEEDFCSIRKDFSLTEEPSREKTQAVKDAVIGLLGAENPEVSDFVKTLSFGYDENSIESFRDLFCASVREALLEQAKDKAFLEQASECGHLGMFDLEKTFAEILTGKDNLPLFSSFMNEPSLSWPEELSEYLFTSLKKEGSLESFSREKLNEALSCVKSVPSLDEEDRVRVMKTVIDTSFTRDLSENDVRGYCDACVSLKRYAEEEGFSEKKTSILEEKLGEYFKSGSDPAVFSDPEKFSELMRDLSLSVSDVDILLSEVSEEKKEKGKEKDPEEER